MTTVNARKVFVPKPEQSTTGAILSAVLGTSLPTDTEASLAVAFTSSGYISEDGVSISTDYSVNDIKEWAGATVRKVLESFDGTIKWTEIELSYEAACHAFGASNVTRTAATTTSGEKLAISIGSELPAAQSWVINMKDGNAKVRIVVPNGQVTSVDEIPFTSTDPVKFGVTLSCYPDTSGKSIYIYTNDGVVVSG